MKKDYLELGQIVGTHGVRGEVRVNPWCDGPEFAKQFKTLYYDAAGTQPVKVLACRPHGNVVLMKLEGVETVEQANLLRSKVLYIARKDANLAHAGLENVAQHRAAKRSRSTCYQ